MAEHFDVIVLGVGPAGGAAAIPLAKAGRKIAMVEPLGYGGTCPLRGCEPKKVLHDVAKAAHLSELAEGMGIESAPAINWPDLQMFKKSFVDPVPSGAKAAYASYGITTLEGWGRFVAEDRVAVESGGSETEYTAGNFVIATGAAPADLGIDGQDMVSISDDFLNLEELPQRITFIGGGYISFEFAFIAAQAGAHVTIAHRSQRVLKQFEPELAARVVEAARDSGIEVHLDCPVTSVKQEGGGLRVYVHGGRDFLCTCDLVVHGAGRQPKLDRLDLHAGGVEFSERGVVVDDRYQSVSNPRVYAAGDCAATRYQLTPVADYEGKAVAKAILGQDFEPLDYPTVPSVTFTMPPLASVGLTEQQAKDRGVAYELKSGSMAGFSSVQRMGYGHAGYKVLLSPDDGTILGAHVLSPHAEEVVNLFAMAMWTKTPASRLKAAPWAYPSFVYEIRHML